jgi:hypothetical protein
MSANPDNFVTSVANPEIILLVKELSQRWVLNHRNTTARVCRNMGQDYTCPSLMRPMWQWLRK